MNVELLISDPSGEKAYIPIVDDKKLIMFPEKHVREFVKTRTCFGKQIMRF